MNDRQNTLQVIDLKTRFGNITYSNLNSNIEKDITRYSYSYGLPSNFRYMNSSEGINKIKVLTESWKYENTFTPNLKGDAFYSFSKSVNDDAYYDFAFSEQFAYEDETYNQSIDVIQEIAKNDTSRTILNNYNYWVNVSDENERAFGFNLKYDFRISNLISGNIRAGTKSKLKRRTFDRHNEYGAVSKAAGGKEQRDSLISIFDLGESK